MPGATSRCRLFVERGQTQSTLDSRRQRVPTSVLSSPVVRIEMSLTPSVVIAHHEGTLGGRLFRMPERGAGQGAGLSHLLGGGRAECGQKARRPASEHLAELCRWGSGY